METATMVVGSYALATFAGGCFWCTQAIFKRLKGVKSVVSGYTGGTVPDPSYEDVCNGTTGHAEAIQIEFDPQDISYEKLLEIFFHLHDPTTLNQQGNDVGIQYRSVIFYHNDKQKTDAQKVKVQIEQEHLYADPIVTEITPFTVYYPAEDYHQNYFENNKTGGYCSYVITPKIQKLLREYKQDVKEEYQEK